jgi:beta-glucanase (GH16 family)
MIMTESLNNKAILYRVSYFLTKQEIMKRQLLLISLGLYMVLFSAKSQEYVLIWEDNFDGTSLDSSVWNIEHKEGVWNTGENQELQFYKKENVLVGDDGSGNSCLILTAKSEVYNGYKFTSGRVNTKSKFSFKNGKVEARIKIPDLANGLWPAFWTLGYIDRTWPDCGEIDIMEMGHAQAITGGIQNKFIGAHLHWGPYPSDYGKEYTAPSGLNDDFHLYQLEWTESQIKVFLDDILFFSMNTDGITTEEFRDYSHYILLNLAVGGSLTQVLNSNNVTAPLPAKMYIDYVKVYQKTGETNYNLGSDTLFGNFGVFEETASVENGLHLGYDADTITKGLFHRAGDLPKEGKELISYNLKADTAFEFKIRSMVDRNMQNYSSGSIQFWMQTESTDTLWIGVSDTLGNETFVPLYDGKENNPLRNGEWQIVWIQLADLSTEINFKAINDFLIIKGKFGENSYILLDRILWYENEYVQLLSDYYGIFAEHNNISESIDFSSNAAVYVWNGFTANTSELAFYGSDVLSYIANIETWNGFGIQSNEAIDLSNYIDGALHFHYKTSGNDDVTIGIKNSEDKDWSYTFSAASELIRNDKWNDYTIPLVNLKPETGELLESDLKDITVLFYMVGTLDISMDEIYLSKNGEKLIYPTTSVNKRSMAFNQVIYPNPADDYFQIKSLKGDLIINLISSCGKIVLSQNIDTPEQKIDISGLCPGIYLVQGYSKDFYFTETVNVK